MSFPSGRLTNRKPKSQAVDIDGDSPQRPTGESIPAACSRSHLLASFSDAIGLARRGVHLNSRFGEGF
jgi:hypothetical protein